MHNMLNDLILSLGIHACRHSTGSQVCRPICTPSNGVCPAPSAQGGNRLLGIAFDKASSDNYYGNCDTFYNNFI